MKVLVNDRRSGVTYHRLVVPMSLLQNELDIMSFTSPHQIRDDSEYDVLIFNRSLGLQKQLYDLLFLTEMKNAGVKIIMDIDDYWELPDHHPIRWREDMRYEHWQEYIINNMFFADLFWTSTPELKTKIQELHPNKEVVVVKNALHPHEPMWSPQKPLWKMDDGYIHVGYVGGTTHYKDLNHLNGAIAKINKYYSKKVMWHHCGFDNETPHGKRVSKQIANIFTCNGKYTKNYKVYGGLPINQYARFYDGMDISIAPLHNNEFNRCKSELKVLEAGQKGCAFIGEDMVTYSRAEEYCEIDLAHSEKDWFEAVMHYAEDRNDLLTYKETLQQQVRAYSVHEENRKRLKSIVNLFS